MDNTNLKLMFSPVWSPFNTMVTLTWKCDNGANLSCTATAHNWFANWCNECKNFPLSPNKDSEIEEIKASAFCGREERTMYRKSDDPAYEKLTFNDFIEAIRPAIVCLPQGNKSIPVFASKYNPIVFIGRLSAQRHIEQYSLPDATIKQSNGVCPICGNPVFNNHCYFCK